ncbi:DNA repair protein [Maribellus luteus]|uniref:DNA repair protein n=1 Tax=Maribellus luteus TaxID=2305463 RepID=A0A399SST5_9BACT|nr:JAB domain-containing protein [Maribellus luteus]RIJ46378.1 DNA repair protein [Maribellus luteus]
MTTLFQQNIAEVSVTYSHSVKPSNQLRVTGSKSVYEYVYPLWPDVEYRERFAVLLLSRGLKILGLSWISTGGVSGTVVDAKLIFQVALKANASSIILLHNHPSGELRTSDADRRITTKLKDGAKLLDMDVPDHIILTSESYYSMADEGEM